MLLSLLLPTGLATRLAKRAPHGFLHGRALLAEQVAVVVSGEADGQSLVGESAARLLEHRAYSGSEGQVVKIPYCVVRPGFKAAFERMEVGSPSQLREWLEEGVRWPFSDEQARAGTNLCCLELRISGTGHLLFGVRLLYICDDLVYLGETELLSVNQGLPHNFAGLAPIESLANKTVGIVGLGSGGSHMALALAAAGVGALHLFDFDRLSLSNLHRHLCGLPHVGRPKVLAVRDVLSSHNLATQVAAHQTNVFNETQKFWDVAMQCDLVIGATDTSRSRRLINFVCCSAQTPLLLGAAFDNARIGELIRVRPHESACYECTRRFLGERDYLIAGDDASSGTNPYAPDQVLSHHRSSQTGTRVDVLSIANLVARAGISTLLESDAEIEDVNRFRLPTDYLTWGAYPDASGDALNEEDPFAFSMPLSINWCAIPRQTGCWACDAASTAKPHDTSPYDAHPTSSHSALAPSNAPNSPSLEERYTDILASLGFWRESASPPAKRNRSSRRQPRRR